MAFPAQGGGIPIPDENTAVQSMLGSTTVSVTPASGIANVQLDVTDGIGPTGPASSIVGATGPTGYNGLNGIGSTGPQGPQGPIGPAGTNPLTFLKVGYFSTDGSISPSRNYVLNQYDQALMLMYPDPNLLPFLQDDTIRNLVIFFNIPTLTSTTIPSQQSAFFVVNVYGNGVSTNMISGWKGTNGFGYTTSAKTCLVQCSTQIFRGFTGQQYVSVYNYSPNQVTVLGTTQKHLAILYSNT